MHGAPPCSGADARDLPDPPIVVCWGRKEACHQRVRAEHAGHQRAQERIANGRSGIRRRYDARTLGRLRLRKVLLRVQQPEPVALAAPLDRSSARTAVVPALALVQLRVNV